MAKSYPPEFRQRALEALANGESVAKVARDLKVSQTSLRGWRTQAAAPAEPQESAEPEERPALTVEVASGDSGRALRALRDTLARSIEAGPADRDLAVLTRRLMDVLAELEKLPKPAEPVKTPLEQVQQKVANELAARRARKSAS